MTRTSIIANTRRFVIALMLAVVSFLICWAPVYAKDITLAWDPNPDDNIDHYIVYWGTESGNYTQISPPIKVVASYTVEGLDEGKVYYFAAKAVGTTGLESDFSNEAAIPIIDSPEDACIINGEEAAGYPIQGRAAAFAAVEIFLNASPLATTTASEDGRWSVNADFKSVPESAFELKAVSTGAESSQVSVQYDKTAPLSQIIAIPTYGAGEIAIQWTSSDAVSGVATTELWYKKGADGDWTKTGLSSNDAEGAFLFNPPAGDGVYYVATRAVDKAGNAEPMPTAEGKGAVIADQQAPSSAIKNLPKYGKDEIAIHWTASDAGSGIGSIELWSKKESNGEWMKSAQASEGDRGTFQFALSSGEGIYYFATRAVDKAGNSGPLPSGNGEGQMICDKRPPSSNKTVRLEKRSASATVEWTAWDDLSGVASTSLFYKQGDGNWTDTGLSQSGASGTFSYSLPAADATYAFQTRSVDRAGNEEPLDADGAGGQIVLDNTPPTSTITKAPKMVQGLLKAEFTIQWTAPDDDSSIDSTELWVKKGADGVWEKSGLPTQEGKSGVFAYQPALGDGMYYFATRTSDSAGNVEELPAGKGETSTLLQADLSDAVMTLQILSGIDVGEVNRSADVNGDGRIGIQEAVYFLKLAAASVPAV